MAVRLFFLLFAATFVSEDAALFAAGALAAQGQISFFWASLACFAGIFTGDILVFLSGRFFGRIAIKRAPFRWFIRETSLIKASDWLNKRGTAAVFISRFTPGLRLPIYFTAGMLKTDFWKFTFYFFLAAAIWTPLVVWTTAQLGMQKFNLWQTVLTVVVLFVVFKLALNLTSWEKRRLLLGYFRRWQKWEFWSMQLFYPPVLAYIVYLWFKHGSLTVFSAANPAIEAGGFIGESKQEIFNGLAKSEAAQSHLLRHVFLSATLDNADKIGIAEDFMHRNALTFPVALKPDVGQRGAGVFIVKDAEELRDRLEKTKVDLILQEFAAGDEFSVFYYRYPNEKRGRIFAMTEKRFPFVTGDGAATLETLILRDKRAVCLAKSYFERNMKRLCEVPANGEKVSLIDIGTHSRGAIFYDGIWAKTDALEAKIDAICRGFEGFYFGRFDLKTTSIEDFQRGENFKIVELNGVTSEATGIYDPKNSLFDAYRVLFEQWRIAFEIGAQNAARGFRPASWIELLRLLFENRFNVPKKQSKIANPQSKMERCA